MAELAAEKESHAQVSKKLEQAKGALERKSATVARLKEAQSGTSREPACAASTEALEQRVQSLQATIDKKEDALRQVPPPCCSGQCKPALGVSSRLVDAIGLLWLESDVGGRTHYILE